MSDDPINLNRSQLQTHANQHRQQATQLMNKRGTLQSELQYLKDQGAQPADIREKVREIQDLNTRVTKEISTAGDLDSAAIVIIVVDTDVLNAMIAINCTNVKVAKAVEKINSIRRIFQYIDLFVRLEAAIIGAAVTRSPGAQIKAVIQAIDTLYQADFPSPPNIKTVCVE